MQLDFSKEFEKFLSTSKKSVDLFKIKEKVVKILKSKASNHELKDLMEIYKSGEEEFKNFHISGKTVGQWAMARVNIFLKNKEKKRPEQIDFVLARLDLLKGSVTDEESKQELDNLFNTSAEDKTLNKPFRLKGEKKKFGVYVKNPKTGNIIMVKFGDPNMDIKRDNLDARKNFRSRHKCDTAKDKTTPRYWSCKMWSKKPVSKIVSSEVLEWDDEESLSEWGWDESYLVDRVLLIKSNPELESVNIFIEDNEC